jgi:hypothetical protein
LIVNDARSKFAVDSCSTEIVARQPPASKDMNMEAEEYTIPGRKDLCAVWRSWVHESARVLLFVVAIYEGPVNPVTSQNPMPSY